MSFKRQENLFGKILAWEIPVPGFLKRKFRKILCLLCVCLSIWLFIPPLFGVYYFPEYNYAWFLSGHQGIGVIVLDRDRPMILCMNNQLFGTRPIHGMKTLPNGKIQFAKEQSKTGPHSFSVKNYFFAISYDEKEVDGRDRTVWCLPMYLPVQFAQAMIQYHRCRDNACGTIASGILDSTPIPHPQLLPSWLDSTLLYLELIIAVFLVLIFVWILNSGLANLIIRLWDKHFPSKKEGGAK